MTIRRLLAASLVVLAPLSMLSACEKKSGTAPSSEQLQRGQQAFLSNCALCHGDQGGGDGELAPLLRTSGVVVARLDNEARMKTLGWEGVRKVIVEGGAHTQRSNLMPAWGERLDASVVNDIADYVLSLPASQSETSAATLRKYLEAPPGVPAEGRSVFIHYCSACHGSYGHGDGTFAVALRREHNIRPRDLTDSTYFAQLSDQTLFSTVSLGGAHVHKSPYMPAWTVSLSPTQIKDVVSYVRVISRTAPRE
jgi:mono/diheme cytochrome c family protein